MSLARLEDIVKSFGGQEVLRGASLRIEKGEKVGLIGRNGSGKSTLFRILAGESEPESGVVERMRRARIASLAQIPEVDPETSIIDLATSRFQPLIDRETQLRDLETRMGDGDPAAIETYSGLEEEFRIRGGYQFRADIKRVLCGLGFREDEFELPFRVLSGGQRTRLMLALVLLDGADLLLLDEPENHLDLQAREWLENFLKEWPNAFVIVSHDRVMLNAVARRIVEIERGQTRSFAGNYNDYLKEKAAIYEDQLKTYKRQQDHIEREERWINRFRYKNTKAKQVQSHIRKLSKLERVEAPDAESKKAKFGLGDVVRSGQKVLEARELSMQYGPLQLYRELSLDVERGERVGIIGPNGSGKSTLLKQLAGRLGEGGGTVTLGHKVSFAYFDQHAEDLDTANDVLTEFQLAFPRMTDAQLRSFLGGFLFSGNDVLKTIASLSGGERTRLALAKLMLENRNLLFLDEPTNHLDIASRESLEAALEAYAGSIVIVSHDRLLIDALVDKLIVIENGSAEIFLGNYSHYRWKRAEEQGAPENAEAGDAMKIRSPAAQNRESKKAAEREARSRDRRLRDVEARIGVVETRLPQYEKRFGETDPADFETLNSLTTEYEALKAELDGLYAEWDGLSGPPAT